MTNSGDFTFSDAERTAQPAVPAPSEPVAEHAAAADWHPPLARPAEPGRSIGYAALVAASEPSKPVRTPAEEAADRAVQERIRKNSLGIAGAAAILAILVGGSAAVRSFHETSSPNNIVPSRSSAGLLPGGAASVPSEGASLRLPKSHKTAGRFQDGIPAGRQRPAPKKHAQSKKVHTPHTEPAPAAIPPAVPKNRLPQAAAEPAAPQKPRKPNRRRKPSQQVPAISPAVPVVASQEGGTALPEDQSPATGGTPIQPTPSTGGADISCEDGFHSC